MRSNQSILKEINPEYSLMLRLKLQYFGHLIRRAESREKTDSGKDWRQEEKGAAEDEMVGWHHQLSGHESQQTPKRQWKTEEPGVLQSLGLQRVRHDLVTEQPLFTQGYFFFFPIGWNWRNTANSFRVSGLEDRQTFVELILSASHSLTSRRSSSASHSVVPDSLWPHGLWSSRLLSPWDSPDKNTGVGWHSLLRESSWPRDWTWVSCIARRFFTVWDNFMY